MIKHILKIKHLYLEYIVSKDKNIIDEIFLIFLNDVDSSSKLMNDINKIIIDKPEFFYDTLRYFAFIYNYNLDDERYITQEELISIDVVLIDYDEETGLIKNPTELERFQAYKNKFLNQ